ncbi:hypothetical protein DFJ73DRAFT_849207 [Zopfochytrium polystomum]|nr:hypothetical protein DFJ73DRAFT_849207 [Zopfochytrium polystomum]
MTIKREFLVKLARAFAMYGAPTHRLEYHMSQVGAVLNVDADFVVYPGLVMASFINENNQASTHIIKISQGFNMGKLAQVNALCLALTRNLITIDDAIELLDGVKSDKDISWIIILATYPIFSFTLAVLSFSSSWLEALIAATLGLMVGFMAVASSNYPSFTNLLDLICTVVARSLQNAFASHGMCYSYINVVLASVSVLLPGLSLTIAIIELSTRNMISGTVRLFSAIFTATLIGFGMTIGGSFVFWKVQDTVACNAESPFWSFLLFWPLAMAVNLSFKAHPKQWIPMMIAAGAGWVAYELLNQTSQFRANTTAVTAICAMIIGLCGNLYARITHDVAVAPILAGILLQVPGSLGVRSSLTFFQNSSNIVDGIQFTFNMLAIGMSLAIGLFVATFVVWPIRGPKYKYLTI